MKKALLLFTGLLISHMLFAQTADELQKLAMTQAQNGQFDSAYQTLDLALKQKPNDMDLLQDKAYYYVLGRRFSDALPIARGLTQRPDANEQCYQVLGMVYDSLAEFDEGSKMYRQAIKQFPSSGTLYAGYGAMLMQAKNFKDAISAWENGIQQDVNNSSNYYYASRYYAANNNLLWSLLYGEIFVNMESYTPRTAEIKELLYDGYTKLFSGGTLAKINADSKGVARAITELLVKDAAPITGDTILALADIRTKFIVDWVNSGSAKNYPFRLFDLHRQLIEAKTFTAYNQWLFGEVANENKYAQWQNTHAAEMQQWQQLLHSVVFKIPAGQYYSN